MKRHFLLLTLAVILLGGLAWLVLWPREPVYQGQPLSYWLRGNDPVKADAAIREAGTNAIPALLRMLRAHDSPLKLKLIALAQKQSILPVKHVAASIRNQDGASGFGRLGAAAADAVPDLIAICDRAISVDSQRLTAFSLGAIGPAAAAAIPSLLRAAAGTNAAVRQSSVRALGQIHSRAEVVVPALVAALQDNDEAVRVDSVFALANFGPAARPAIPALVEALGSSDAAVRSVAEDAIGKIDSDNAARLVSGGASSRSSNPGK